LSATAVAGPAYRIEPTPGPAGLHARQFQVTLTIQAPARNQMVSLPVWIPGSYLVREFAKNLHSLTATQGSGKASQAVVVEQLDKHRWRLACAAGQPLQLRYRVDAFDNSVRTAWLDAHRGFFNGTSLCLRVEGQSDLPHTLELSRKSWPGAWKVATGLPPARVDRSGFGVYRAADYDELVDCPVELGDFWSGTFKACGVPHRFVVAGAPPGFDGDKLLSDTQKICEAQIRFWHAEGRAAGDLLEQPPFQSYVFLLNAVDDGYGGLEHRNSTALICGRRDLPRLATPGASKLALAKPSDGYTTLLGLISHEYFHTWNVKRLRPAEFARYDYATENYTELLWFFEGFTSYYDDLFLVRAGLIDSATYLKLLAKTANQVLQSPGRLVQSVAQASFDAWVKYYRSDENTANVTVSYYTKGALVALCLDLALRQAPLQGRAKPITLDDLMRSLWQRCKAGPLKEKDLKSALVAHGQLSIWERLQAWVHGVAELPVRDLLAVAGITVTEEPDALAQALGVRVAESNGSLVIKQVLRGGVAERAGFSAGDEWLSVDVEGGAAASAWRVRKLDDVVFYAGPASQVTAWVARDARVLRLDLALPPRDGTRSSTRQFKLAKLDAQVDVPAWFAAS
jgi:predicted metalloprotease with PDZ domain